MYEENMLVKHFKGTNLYEKNIYRILKLHVQPDQISKEIEYTGKNEFAHTKNLVIYENIFQEGKIFAREEEDLVTELSKEDQETYHQIYRVEPLSLEEEKEIAKEEFQQEKRKRTEEKYARIRK